MTKVDATLGEAAREYAARKAAAEARVVRWEHWSAPAYDPKPYYFERLARRGVVRRGRRLARPSARGCAYGFDAQGRVVIDRQPKSDEPPFDEFFSHGRSGVESAAYDRDGAHALRYVTRQRLRGGRPVSTEVLDALPPFASYAERYRYRGGRLDRIDVESRAGKDAAVDRITYDVVYEPDGRLRAIRRHYDYLPRPFPVYWNPELGDSLERLSQGVRRALLEAIPRAVRGARVREPAYCLALAYDEAGDELPPALGIGLERERRALLAKGATDARQRLWDPARFSRYRRGAVKLTAPGLSGACEKLLQYALMGEALWVPQRLLNDVAAALNRRTWRGVLPTTDDFVVYAVNFDGDELAENLKAGLLPAKLKLLRSRRLV